MTGPGDTPERAAAFRRNEALERLLAELNAALGGAEQQLIANAGSQGTAHPLVFVMGPLRSGTTLFMQWLATTGLVAYPTNLMSRFYAAPVTGAKIQQLLTDPRFNFRNEILDFNAPVQFTSDNGKTQGALAPNEFWYFWRRFLPFRELDWLPDHELLAQADCGALVGALQALTQVFDRPFALKGMILNYNLHFLDVLFRKALFVQIRRDAVANVESVLEARRRQYGDESTWYSFKIPEYHELLTHDPVHQAAGQIHYINRALEAGMQRIPESRTLVVDYEQFCADPAAVFQGLVSKLGLATAEYTGPAQFRPSREVAVARNQEIVKALTFFERKSAHRE